LHEKPENCGEAEMVGKGVEMDYEVNKNILPGEMIIIA